MICLEAVKEAAMALPFAIAIAGLLCKNLGDFLCHLVRLANVLTLELNWVERYGKRHCVLRAWEVNGNSSGGRIVLGDRPGANADIENACEYQDYDHTKANHGFVPHRSDFLDLCLPLMLLSLQCIAIAVLPWRVSPYFASCRSGSCITVGANFDFLLNCHYGIHEDSVFSDTP